MRCGSRVWRRSQSAAIFEGHVVPWGSATTRVPRGVVALAIVASASCAIRRRRVMWLVNPRGAQPPFLVGIHILWEKQTKPMLSKTT